MGFEQTMLRVGVASRNRVNAVKRELEQLRGRQVTYSEVIDELVAHWESTAALVRNAREAGR
jgi:hypothetical protein